MAYLKIVLIILSICLPIIALLFLEKQLIAISFLIIGVLLIPLIITFRKTKLRTQELVTLSLIGTIAAITRIPFAALPSVQPTTFIIITTAIVIGPQGGFIIGLLAAFISNLFLGHGPWTLFQMLAWSLIGFYAGVLKDTFVMRTLFGRCAFGFLVGILFGWFMNLSFIIFIIQKLDWAIILPYYAASFIFDLNHAITNALLLLFFSPMWINMLQRFTKRYDLFKRD